MAEGVSEESVIHRIRYFGCIASSKKKECVYILLVVNEDTYIQLLFVLLLLVRYINY